MRRNPATSPRTVPTATAPTPRRWRRRSAEAGSNFQTFDEIGLAVKRSTGGEQQPWVSSSPIDGSFYFAGAPASVTDARPLDSAPRRLGGYSNTTETSRAVNSCRQSVPRRYGSMARARLEELKPAKSR